jgi:hypothetical protein
VPKAATESPLFDALGETLGISAVQRYTQSNERTTAFFHDAVSFARRSWSMAGSQRCASAQLHTTSSVSC